MSIKGPQNLPTVSAHHLHDKCSLMRVGSTDDGIDRLDDPVQSRIRTDGHVRSAEIVINGTDHAGNVQALVLGALFLSDLTRRQQFVQQTGPLLPEQVGTGQRTVTSDHHQIGDATGDQVEGGLQAAGSFLEVHAASGTDDGTTPMNNTGYRGPVGFHDVVTAVHHALVTLTDEVDLEETEQKTRTNQFYSSHRQQIYDNCL